MMDLLTVKNQLFSIHTDEEFNHFALLIFQYQYDNNLVYHQYCKALNVNPSDITHYNQIPFLPVEFFKNHKIISCDSPSALIFTSSGTTGMQTSRHFIHDPEIYRTSFSKSFRLFFGDPEEFHILALLPGYLEREGSSLIYMVNDLIIQSKSTHSGFYLNEYDLLKEKIEYLANDPRKILLLGVSFALLDLAERHSLSHSRLIVMETGGMKGRRKELVREELHQVLTDAFGVEKIASEYGMTELLSQAYSRGQGIYSSPPWMKILVRETNDPFSYCLDGTTGGVNVIDLANVFSCSFIATQDLGKITGNNLFEITGRFDNSDVRGCNLLI
jgi:phenylacetate-coenzyme A ligase PaaK-like adenylate-forming protein